MVRWAGSLLARGPMLGALLVGVGVSAIACSRSSEEPASCAAPGVTNGDPSWRPGSVGARAGFSPGASIFDAEDDELRRELESMAGLGARWVRLDVDWSHVARRRGHLDFCATDRVMVAARRAGLDVVALPAYSPGWARPAGTSDKHGPTDEAAYAEFVGAAVSRYRPLGVKVWELWNEPNVSAFWRPKPDPIAYARLLAAGAEAARTAAPDVMVLPGGLAPAEDDPEGESLSPETFLRHLYRAGVGTVIDGVAVHPYSYPSLPLDPSSSDWNQFLRLPRIRSLMEANGDADKLVWISEFGAPTGDSKRAVSPRRQATMASEVFRAASRWPWVGPVLWYSYRDAGNDTSDIEDNFGLVRHDFGPKPAEDAFRRALQAPSPP